MKIEFKIDEKYLVGQEKDLATLDRVMKKGGFSKIHFGLYEGHKVPLSTMALIQAGILGTPWLYDNAEYIMFYYDEDNTDGADVLKEYKELISLYDSGAFFD